MGVGVDRDPVAVILPEPVRTEALDSYRAGGEVEAVKVVRRRTGLDLLSSVRAVRALIDGGA